MNFIEDITTFFTDFFDQDAHSYAHSDSKDEIREINSLEIKEVNSLEIIDYHYSDALLQISPGNSFTQKDFLIGRLFIFKEKGIRIYAERIFAKTFEQMEAQFSLREYICRGSHFKHYPMMVIAEDRWFADVNLMKRRLAAHLGAHRQVYARDCEVRRIEKPVSQAFMEKYHSYGKALARYRYGLFVKRFNKNAPFEVGGLIGVAEFSNARRWIKQGRKISSYEWVRAAFLPSLRVAGGMGKLLKYFIRDVEPDDIMTYADLEWSDGDVYDKLGFQLEQRRKPIEFVVTCVAASSEFEPVEVTSSELEPVGDVANIVEANCKRIPMKNFQIQEMANKEIEQNLSRSPHAYLYKNSGSLKYRLRF